MCLLASWHSQTSIQDTGPRQHHLKPIDILFDFDFVLPLKHVHFIFAFNRSDFTEMSSSDRHGRRLGTASFAKNVHRNNVAQCGPYEFIVCHDFDSPKLGVFDSGLKCLRTVDCKDLVGICCNSKFVFGLWDTSHSYNYPYRHRQVPDLHAIQHETHKSRHMIQVHHVHTLSEVICLRVPKE